MKFRANTEDLIKALDCISVVTPHAVTPQGAAGYLFVVREGRCYVYSRDTMCVARADFPVFDSEEDGSFAYPAAHAEALRLLMSSSVIIEAASDGEKFVVKYRSESGASSERASFDPVLLSTCDTDLEKSPEGFEFPAGMLREAITMARPFLAKPEDNRSEEQFKGLVVFDQSKPEWAKGDGTLYAANGTQSLYFHCDLFAGKGLEIHGQHLSALVAFLAKSTGNVSVRKGDSFVFAQNSQGQVLGWPRHAKTHGKYSYYPLKTDGYVLSVQKAVLLNALKYTRSELDPKRDKIKVAFDVERKTLQFGVVDGGSKAESFPVPVTPKTMPEQGFSINANIDHFMALINSVKALDVELRIAIIPKDPAKGVPKDLAFIRTIDTFNMTPEGKVVVDPEGSYSCKVTRFVPSKD